MKKIKIAFIISNLGQGGAEKQLVELIKGIDKNKFSIHLFLYAYQKEAFYTEILNLKDISIFTNRLNKKLSINKIFEALIYIRRILKNNNYNVVFTTLFMNSFFVRLTAPKRYNHKIIASSRTSILLYNKFRIFIEKYFIRKSYLVCNSEKTRKHFFEIVKNKYHFRIKMIYNGFNVMNPKISVNKSSYNDRIIIGGLGRMSSEKNFLQLARVFKRLDKNNVKKLELLLQGSSGNETHDIEKLIKNCDCIKVRQANPNVELFFNKINILVIPSKFEGCPNVLFEGMMYKILCIISKGANSDNFVTNGVNGFVYNGTDKGLSDAILDAIMVLDTNKKHKIVNNAYKYVNENFSTRHMVNNYEKLFTMINQKYN